MLIWPRFLQIKDKFSILRRLFLVAVLGILVISGAIFFQSFSNQQKPDQSIILAKTKLASAIFHHLSQSQIEKAEDLTREQLRLIVSKPQFFPSLAIVEKYQQKIITEAERLKIPKDLALGMALLENGGAETAISPAGAVGIFQITTPTAKTLGLKVNDQIDERLVPEKNIEAGLAYLNYNLSLFSDIGLAVWAYHAGPQNVSAALKIYLKSIGEKDAFDLVEAEKLGKLSRAKYVWRAYATKDGLDIHKLLENFQVKLNFLPKLSDESQLYVYKVLAATVLFQTEKSYQNPFEFEEKVALFKQGRILMDNLLDPSSKLSTQ